MMADGIPNRPPLFLPKGTLLGRDVDMGLDSVCFAIFCSSLYLSVLGINQSGSEEQRAECSSSCIVCT